MIRNLLIRMKAAYKRKMIRAVVARVRTLPEVLVGHLRVRKRIRRMAFIWNRLPNWSKRCIAIAISAKLVTYTWLILYWAFPIWSMRLVDPFLCPGYSHPFSISWFIKSITDDWEWILFVYAAAMAIKRVSDTVFLVFFIIFAYQVIDHLMFWWNYKTSYAMYIDIMWTVLILIWTAIKGHKKETLGRIKGLF